MMAIEFVQRGMLGGRWRLEARKASVVIGVIREGEGLYFFYQGADIQLGSHPVFTRCGPRKAESCRSEALLIPGCRTSDPRDSGGAWTVIATDRMPQPVPAVRNLHDDYTTAALRRKEALAKQWGSDWFSLSS
jgi:hypothetical protein